MRRRHGIARPARGFSVLELSIAMAIAGIVVAAATTAAVNVTRLLKLEGKKSVADQDARRIVDFVVGQLQNAGGGPVRPWMATWLEEDCTARNGLPACNGHDRLTVVEIDPLRSVCAIESITATSITFAAPDGVCCFAWPEDADLTTTDEPDQYATHQLMLTNGRNTWSMVTSDTTDVDTCTVALTGIMPLSAWSQTVASSALSTRFTGGGVAVPVVAHTWYLGAPAPTLGTAATLPSLLEWVDEDLNGVADEDEAWVVFPGVVDFQVALG
ncbi:MAG TPA: prepilin-type N-terminal cleavage/methylation domain-containing protein, partial [Myxococcota bacterium]